MKGIGGANELAFAVLGEAHVGRTGAMPFVFTERGGGMDEEVLQRRSKPHGESAEGGRLRRTKQLVRV